MNADSAEFHGFSFKKIRKIHVYPRPIQKFYFKIPSISP